MFTQSREETRKFFRTAWQKRLDGMPLQPLEAVVTDVIAAHPEYHEAVTGEALDGFEQDPDHNPFLHMGLHIALREQLQADHPAGIRATFQTLHIRFPEMHAREHGVMQLLAQMLWESQQSGAMPDEQIYLQRVRELVS